MYCKMVCSGDLVGPVTPLIFHALSCCVLPCCDFTVLVIFTHEVITVPL